MEIDWGFFSRILILKKCHKILKFSYKFSVTPGRSALLKIHVFSLCLSLSTCVWIRLDDQQTANTRKIFSHKALTEKSLPHWSPACCVLEQKQTDFFLFFHHQPKVNIFLTISRSLKIAKNINYLSGLHDPFIKKYR